MANNLIFEDSPYLQQHAHNPVDWYPWNDEAFMKSYYERKPIFLSIGYSSCHWCHVMEREVFESEEIAKILNAHFICIKLDKEERPDIDKYYQNLYQIINKRGGGWPLSMFLTHEKKPFYAATYIPPATFIKLAKDIIELYSHDFQGVSLRADQLNHFANLEYNSTQSIAFESNFLDLVEHKLSRDFDTIYGGFGHAPKFPHTSSINLALILFQLGKNEKTLHIATKTLKAMAKGGLRDIVDGGFCRYSTDDIWLVPHFEKMTYDNGLLCESYARAYGVTKEPFYFEISKEIADFMFQFMAFDGLFYSASDADSEDNYGKKHEGEYFVYGYEEVLDAFVKLFGEKKAKEYLVLCGVTKHGNFEGKNIIRNENLGILPKEVIQALQALRQSKAYPFIDKKCITAWNAMMIKGLLQLSCYDKSYLQKGLDSLDSLLAVMWTQDRLYHSFLIGGKEPSIEAFLEDYGYLCDSLLMAYEVTLQKKYLELFLKIASQAIEKFYVDGKWYFSKGQFSTDGDLFDGSYPSSVAVMNKALYIYGSLVGDYDCIQKALQSCRFYSEFLVKNPTYSAVFSEVILMEQIGVMVYKGNKELLNQIMYKKEQHPFVYFVQTEDDVLSLCSKGSCQEVII